MTQPKVFTGDLCFLIFRRRKMVSWLLLVALASTTWAVPPPPRLQGFTAMNSTVLEQSFVNCKNVFCRTLHLSEHTLKCPAYIQGVFFTGSPLKSMENLG